MRDTLEIKFTDLLIWICAMLLIICLAVCVISPRTYNLIGPLLLSAWGLLVPVLYAVLSAFLTLGYYIACSAYEIVAIAIYAFYHLPLAWYIMAVLTVLPMCLDIPKSGMVVYLASYCFIAWFICVSLPTKKKKAATPLVPQAPTQSHLFAGMKITVNPS